MTDIKGLTLEEMEAIRKQISEPSHVKIIKILIVLLGIAVVIFFVYANFFQEHSYDYYYDIGSAKDNFLSPAERISDKVSDSDYNSRNLTSQLVYFSIPISSNSDAINVSIKFKDNFPENGKLYIGPRDREEWHYKQYLVYSKLIETLMQEYNYEYNNGLILINLNNTNNYTIDQIMSNPENLSIKLITDQNISMKGLKLDNYKPGNFEINTALRESTEFYVYVKGNLKVNVEKRDLNWYDINESGADELKIILYDLNGHIIANSTIRDDGITGKQIDKSNKNTISGELLTDNLEEGVYRLVLSNNGDMIITKISLNQNKIVANKRVFLAQSNAYFNNFDKKNQLFFKSPSLSSPKLAVKTYHNNGINQTINITNSLNSSSLTSYSLDIPTFNEDHFIVLSNSESLYKIIPEKSDIIISAPGYFSFSEDSWFNPLPYGKFVYKNDINYIKSIEGDYILVAYTPVISEGEWKEGSINIGTDNVYISNNGRLSMLIITDHLGTNKNETNKMFIPIDWLDIKVHKNGLINEWRENE